MSDGMRADPGHLTPGQTVRVEIEGTVVQMGEHGELAALQLADGSIWGPFMPKSAKFYVTSEPPPPSLLPFRTPAEWHAREHPGTFRAT